MSSALWYILRWFGFYKAASLSISAFITDIFCLFFQYCPYSVILSFILGYLTRLRPLLFIYFLFEIPVALAYAVIGTLIIVEAQGYTSYGNIYESTFFPGVFPDQIQIVGIWCLICTVGQLLFLYVVWRGFKHHIGLLYWLFGCMFKLTVGHYFNHRCNAFRQQNAHLPRLQCLLLAFMLLFGVLMQVVIFVGLLFCGFKSIVILPALAIFVSIPPTKPPCGSLTSIFIQILIICGYVYFGSACISYGLNGLDWDEKEEGMVIPVLVLGILTLVSIPSIFTSVILECRNYNRRDFAEFNRIR
ncbi:hypothetical protein M3Y97_00178800 [Aphelenchoides bicaudatus]|nr:hypothetical protein M3Y97_00178800 [Aphelenchoides bicaudatus]